MAVEPSSMPVWNWVTTLLGAFEPAPAQPLVYQNTESNFSNDVAPIIMPAPRPKTDKNGAERIIAAFENVPQLPGHIDFAYDPIARYFKQNVVAMRIGPQIIVATIANWPTSGPLAMALQEATASPNGYTWFRMSSEDLGGLRVELMDTLSNAPVQVDSLTGMVSYPVEKSVMMHYDKVALDLDLVTSLKVAEKVQSAGMAKFFVDTFFELVTLAPVPGSAGHLAQGEMFNRLPLQVRMDMAMGGRPTIVPEITLSQYGGSRLGIVGLEYVREMRSGFEQEAPPAPRRSAPPVPPIEWAGLLTGLGSLISRVRGMMPSGQQQSPGNLIPVGRAPTPVRTPVAVSTTRPSGARLQGARDTQPREAEDVGVRKRPRDRSDRVTAPGALPSVVLDPVTAARQQVVTDRHGAPVYIVTNLEALESMIPRSGSAVFVVVKLPSGAKEVRVSQSGVYTTMLIEGETAIFHRQLDHMHVDATIGLAQSMGVK